MKTMREVLQDNIEQLGIVIKSMNASHDRSIHIGAVDAYEEALSLLDSHPPVEELIEWAKAQSKPQAFPTEKDLLATAAKIKAWRESNHD